MKEIARRAVVAPMTVSRALADPDKVSPETLARVMAVVDREGFIRNQLASSMRSRRRIIGTMVPPLINAGIAEQVQGMSDACHEAGYQLHLIQGDFDAQAEENAVRALLGWQPAGLILQAFVQSRAARQLLKLGEHAVVEISEIRGRKPIDMVVGVSNFDPGPDCSVSFQPSPPSATFSFRPVHAALLSPQTCVASARWPNGNTSRLPLPERRRRCLCAAANSLCDIARRRVQRANARVGAVLPYGNQAADRW